MYIPSTPQISQLIFKLTGVLACKLMYVHCMMLSRVAVPHKLLPAGVVLYIEGLFPFFLKGNSPFSVDSSILHSSLDFCGLSGVGDSR